MTYLVYVLESKKNGLRYIGFTQDLTSRLKEHNEGRNTSTKKKGPWVLVHSESFPTHLLAQKRERFLKSGHGRKVLTNIFAR
ncbi:MAG: GIY-YIG nuclease family protein [Candidatus Omnitrophica bacterium]|nr:GIY-YIG nuclease family protein [Candidatus Omnitrophota bacterium]